MRSLSLLALLLAPLALALPTDIESRQSATTCGSNKYTALQVSSAAKAACSYVNKGTTAGSSKYPEKYNDYEGFSFNGVKSPYYEFPILESGTYTGGSPGADRVVINSACTFAGVITHTGASGNDFVGCTGTS